MKTILYKILLLFFSLSLLSFFTGFSGAYFTDSGNTNSNSFSATCWDDPAATPLNSPANDTNSNATDITFMWTSTTSSCPIAALTYNFQIFSDVGLTTLVASSGFSGSLSYIYNSIPEGEYWWRVQAKDQYSNSSNSSAYHLVVDRTSPGPISLQISNSWTKEIVEKITSNGGFESGNLSGWTTAGNVSLINSTDSISAPLITVTPNSGTYMARLGNPDDPGKYVWENRLMRSFDSGAKSLSLYYNFFSRETTGFDEPGFFIRVNGQEVFRQNNLGSDGTNALNTGWNQFNYDLSSHTDSKVNLSIYSGNTGDTLNQSWAYIDDVSTYFASAPISATYTISGNDNLGGSGISHYEYNIDSGGWTSGSSFIIGISGTKTVQYRSIDNAGNYSVTQFVTIVVDATAPADISTLAISSTTLNSVDLSWTAPGNDGLTGKAASYDIRYSTTNITNDATFNSAIRVDKVPSPKSAGSAETLAVTGLDPGTLYYFSVKTSDEAPNTSTISNVVSTTTLAGLTVNPEDIVINEVMWMGTSASTNDQYVELRNMTNRMLSLTGFKLYKYDGTTLVDMGITFDGKSITPNGYFFITKYDPASISSKLKDSLSLASNILIDSNLDILPASDLKLELLDDVGTVIDSAWNATAPTEGIFDSTLGAEKYYSMERTSVPGDGTQELNWYTCIDEASSTDFFEGGDKELGTPGSANRSENEPLAHMKKLNRAPRASPTPTIVITPFITPILTTVLTGDSKTISFSLQNIVQYVSLNYELTYDSATGAQGILGETKLDKQPIFEKKDITLGTCSTGGTCVYHTAIKNLKLVVTLVDEKEVLTVLTKEIQ